MLLFPEDIQICPVLYLLDLVWSFIQNTPNIVIKFLKYHSFRFDILTMTDAFVMKIKLLKYHWSMESDLNRP